jgi:hypothetical protein
LGHYVTSPHNCLLPSPRPVRCKRLRIGSSSTDGREILLGRQLLRYSANTYKFGALSVLWSSTRCRRTDLSGDGRPMACITRPQHTGHTSSGLCHSLVRKNYGGQRPQSQSSFSSRLLYIVVFGQHIYILGMGCKTMTPAFYVISSSRPVTTSLLSVSLRVSYGHHC